MQDSSSKGSEKKDFLAAIRRELYSPLNQILGKSEIYLEEAKGLERQDALVEVKKIHTAAKYLYALMNSSKKEVSAELVQQLKAGADTAVSSIQGFVQQEMKQEPVKANPVLVVDDRETNRELLCEILAEQGHLVEDVENGMLALERLKQKPFDLVLLDIMMPKMDGYQVLQHIKNDQELRHVPVIMLSGLDEINSVIRCIEMGAEDYLPKPFNPILLKARIEACLEKKRLRDQEQAFLKQLQIEQGKAEHLLLNVLPKPIADRLKQGENIIVDSFPEVTVLFADLADFTALSAQVSPAELVHYLNEIFSRFDRLAEKHGLEKIKTIGDAYMAVGGLPTPRPDHAEAVGRMSLDMLEEMKALNQETGRNLNLRIGLNTGPVIAGIIGRNKFIYDLWGDTVNIASRMQSQGHPGFIQVTRRTRDKLKDKFLLEERGVIEVKGKGEMATWILKAEI
jgi:adenylate cyclase